MSDQREAMAKRAMDSQAQPRKGFGQVKFVDLKNMVYDKQARQFLETEPDDPEGQLEITIGIETFKRDGSVFVAERKMLDSSFGVNNWRDITLASLKRIRTNVLDLENKWVAFEFRPIKRWDKELRQVVEDRFDTFWFTQVFSSREECENAHVANMLASSPPSSSTDSGDDTADDTTAAAPATTPSQTAIEQAVINFYKLMKNDDAKFLSEATKNPMFMKHFGTAEKALAFVTEDLPF